MSRSYTRSCQDLAGILPRLSTWDCEIWHKKYATAIMKILGEVFDDMEEYYEDNEMFEDKENSTIVS